MNLIGVPLACGLLAARSFLFGHHELLVFVLHIFAVDGYAGAVYQHEIAGTSRHQLAFDGQGPDLVRSAGVEKHGMNKYAIQVMAEAGVNISGHTSKLVDELPEMNFDYVITVCDNAHESCPIFPGSAKIIHKAFDDPPRLAANAGSEEEALDCYRKVRDEIKEFIQTIPKSLNDT